MRMLYNIPIESLEERYSADWNKWFPNEFKRNGVAYETIYSDTLTDTIKNGSFLDVCSTNYFKAGQLKHLTKKLFTGEIKDGDTLFFHDLWFPGLEMLQYIRQGKGIDFKICGILHAGTYDPYDFLSKRGMGSWGEQLENSWFNFIDKIFVATLFHKELILTSRIITPNKIIVTGLPIFKPLCPSFPKENIVVFPHRLDPEKNPQMFDALAKECKDTGWRFVKSKEVCNTKGEYYKLLAQSKMAVSFADQETWGIAQLESVFMDCIPVVPDRLSYSELYKAAFKYQDFEECVSKVKQFIQLGDMYQDILYLNKEILLLIGELAVNKMLKEMKLYGNV
ncbi:MAG: hypothetical protein ABIC57_04180 [bacterium]